ncbi:MAG TPA: efflux transporter periplasmic adaptor subunit [Desulfobulbaceae bacterium]|nr:efflux transporter periplasmic adaptor subunit [Desulfobulbaceae bacterium]
MKIRFRRTLLVAGAVALLFLLSGCDNKGGAQGPPPAGPPEVGIMEVKPQLVELTTELSGRTAPRLIAEVRPQVTGIIQKRLFTEGADVKKGEVLYQIDDAMYRADIAKAKATLARAEAYLVPARLKAERFGELVQVNAISKQEADDAAAARKQAEAEILAASAAFDAARINLDYTVVKAPISGRIGRSAVTTGALVTANQATPLATVQQLDPIFVDVTQSAAEMLRMQRNLGSGLLKGDRKAKVEVTLLLEDGTPYPLPGELKFSEVTVEQSTGSVTLRAEFPNPEQTLLPGMFVRAVVPEGVNEQAILVPQRGVTRNPSGQAMVMLVGAEEKVEPRVIQVARTINDSWLVSDGLKPGDRVILEGLQKARPGTPVKTVPFGSKPEPAPAGTPPGAAKK